MMSRKGVIMMPTVVRTVSFGVVLFAVLVAALGLSNSGLAAEPLVLAIARFDDRSNSGFANVGEGVADLLTEKLVNRGIRVVERAELESILMERQLNPLIREDMALAAQLLGADLLLIGSVTNIDVQETSLSLGFFAVSGATVTTDLSSRLVSVYTSEILRAASVTGNAEGTTGFSLNLGQLFSNLSGIQANVCTGGFLTGKSTYVQGEIVYFGYRDPATANTFRVLVKNSLGTVIWVSSWNSSSPAAPCVTWAWDQRDFWGNPVAPGSYTAELWLGVATLAAIRPFSIAVGAPPVWVNELTVGTQEFSDTVVGEAVENALEQLVAKLGTTLAQIEPQVLGERDQTVLPAVAGALQGRVVAIIDESTVAIDIGQEAGVEQYTAFEVYDAFSVHDPSTGELIEVIPLTDFPKGELIVTRVQEQVSVAAKLGLDFPVNIGDLVIAKQEGASF
jgi:hypothetical protein